MKDCARVKRLLSRFIDEEADSSDVAFVNSHIETCLDCRHELKRLLSAKDFISKAQKKSLPPGYIFELLRDKLRDRQSAGAGFSISNIGYIARRLMPVPAAAFLFSAVLLLLSSFYFRSDDYLLYENILKGVPATTESVLELILDAGD
ncbi:MAG: zf-HC2 domain-containing protein [Candidatus Omnitrophica bacterium]|nr:zf-HC2 domain-containing protein [Candidatus Omnitrophota bacterium]